MAEPFLSEIRLFAFNFPPKGWAFCDGQILPINQNAALFALIGTFYGGNGVSNFALPNFQGRVAIHQGGNFVLGESSGESEHALVGTEMPSHAHAFTIGGTANSESPAGDLFGTPAVNARLGSLYSSTGGSIAAPDAIGATGSSQPHNNMQPYTVLNYSIALQGIFPSQN